MSLVLCSRDATSPALPHMGLSASVATGVEVTGLFLKENRVSSSITYAFQAVSVQGMAGDKHGQVRMHRVILAILRSRCCSERRTYSNVWVDIALGIRY